MSYGLIITKVSNIHMQSMSTKRPCCHLQWTGKSSHLETRNWTTSLYRSYYAFNISRKIKITFPSSSFGLDKLETDCSEKLVDTWREGTTDGSGQRVAQGALHPAGQDVEQQAGDWVQALATGETLARRSGDSWGNLLLLLGVPEPQHPPKAMICMDLWRQTNGIVDLQKNYTFSDLHMPRNNPWNYTRTKM